MEIKPIDQDVQGLLRSAFYRIPRFQRPYSWDQENVEDFWNDAIASPDPDYFIGSFVLYRERPGIDTMFVVDGQQRLSTITVLLAAVRDKLDELGFNELAVGVHLLVERQDIDSKQQFILQSETPYPYLQEHIQKHGPPSVNPPMGAEERSLAAAYQYLCAQLDASLNAVDQDSMIPLDRKLEVKKEKLLRVRDKLLRLQLISVVLTSEDEAYLIFETLNTRGKDLEPADMVKNHITRLARPANLGVDIARDKWNEMRDRFEQTTPNIDVNRFIHHYWLSTHNYTTIPKLFKEIKRAIDADNVVAFLDELVSDSAIYRSIVDTSAVRWTKQESDVRNALDALNLFRVQQPIPMLLSILRAYRAGALSLGQVKSILTAMENFHTAFTAVAQTKTGGGTALMYASAARQLKEAADKDSKGRVLREFIGKLRERLPSQDEYNAAFAELYYTSGVTRERGIVRYLLRRLDMHLRGATPVDYDRFSIEHLAPEHPQGNDPKVEASHVGTVGNLILIPEGVNQELANKSFRQKKAILTDRGIPMDDVLRAADSWDESTIATRTTALGTLTLREILTL